MKRSLLIVLTACALAAGCDDDNSTAPTNAPLVFSAQLSPANENPPIANAEAGGRGAAQITFDVTRDSSSAITGATATFHFQVAGFPGTSVVGAHIHVGGPSVNGPIVVNTGVSATAPVPTADGTGTFSVSGIPVAAALMQAIVDNPAGYYFNVHSPLNPGGFARGQLTRVQ